MHTQFHTITSEGSGPVVQLRSHHFGRAGGRKAYIQAGLHADEVPGMLVCQYLRSELARLEGEGRIDGEIILVPAANPLGLGQWVLGMPAGRFDLSSGVNFNRAFPHVGASLAGALAGLLGTDLAANTAMVRTAARAAVADTACTTDAAALKRQLLLLAIDADIVLDLHCDNEALLHVYTGTPLLEACTPLALLAGARALLVTREAGGEPFDEACSRLWWELADAFGPQVALAPACMAATVELRGERDVDYALAHADGKALLDYLAHAGMLDLPLSALPSPQCHATPLEGVAPIVAPHAGMLVFRRALGERVAAGETVADLVDPASGATRELRAAVDGVLFARSGLRHVQRGMNVCKIAGSEAFRAGQLLSM